MTSPNRPRHTLILWVAQGFGIGWLPIAPGTFGSVLGLAWFLLLIEIGKPWILIVGSIAGAALAIWFCGVAERMLGKKDPGSVVLDEIAAMPVCFWSWVAVLFLERNSLPPLEYFFVNGNWLLTLGVFLAFRLFDVVKPWPVRQSQSLPGGWGIAVDDLLAAVYVNAVFLAAHWAGWV